MKPFLPWAEPWQVPALQPSRERTGVTSWTKSTWTGAVQPEHRHRHVDRSCRRGVSESVALPSALGRTRPERETSATSAESFGSTIRVTSIDLARGELAGDQELDVGESVDQPDLLGLDLEATRGIGPCGQRLGLDGLLLLGRDRGDRCRSGPPSAVLTDDGGELLDDRAGLRVDQPDDPIAAGGGQDLAVGPEGDGVDRRLGAP